MTVTTWTDGKYDRRSRLPISYLLSRCEYILYRGLYRTSYLRVSRGKVTDTELQAGQFVVPGFGHTVIDDSEAARYLRIHKETLDMPHVRTFFRVPPLRVAHLLFSGSPWNIMEISIREERMGTIIMYSEPLSTITSRKEHCCNLTVHLLSVVYCTINCPGVAIHHYYSHPLHYCSRFPLHWMHYCSDPPRQCFDAAPALFLLP